MSKTVVSGGQWVEGRLVGVEEPALRLSSGEVVPFMSVEQMYGHVGVPRSVSGSGKGARAKVARLFMLFIERLPCMNYKNREPSAVDGLTGELSFGRRGVSA
jgi:hypothetical protein